MVAFDWTASQRARSEGETAIEPSWSFTVLPDGSLDPFLPGRVTFRDGNLVRPVCPFVEVWARIGDPQRPPQTWTDAPLTEALLQRHGVGPSALKFTVDARNAKAARRAELPELVFGTFPPVVISGDTHHPVALAGTNPIGTPNPLIPAGRSIPLGSLQVIRSRANPAPGRAKWPSTLDLEVIRFRYTPAKGRFYGPPAAATATAESAVPAVTAARAFLNPAARWFNATGAGGGFVIPADTFDMQDAGADGSMPSLGVIDDTCELRVDIELALPAARVVRTHATVFVAPPDFAPDRRPFLTIADELNDRNADAAPRSAAMSAAELDEWVSDLFSRIHETVSLMNVDFWRSAFGWQPLPPKYRAASPLPGDGVAPADQAMGSRDSLRTLVTVPAPSRDLELPLSERARAHHRALADLQRLKNLVRQNPERLRQLIRAPFEVEAGESRNAQSMRMPPFMSHSNAGPLTLSAWQYALVMRWVDLVLQPQEEAAEVAPAELSPEAAARREAVLGRLPP
jgi:hypothetical protein